MKAIKFLVLTKQCVLQLLQLVPLLVLPACTAQTVAPNHTLTIGWQSNKNDKSKHSDWVLTDEHTNGGFKGVNIQDGYIIRWKGPDYGFSLIVSNLADWKILPYGQLRPDCNTNNNEGIIDSAADPNAGNVQTVNLQFTPKHHKAPTDQVDIHYVILAGPSGDPTSRGPRAAVFHFPFNIYEDMAAATMTWQ